MDITECTPLEWHSHEQGFLELLKDPNVWNKLPYVNANELHHLKDSRLVRFQGMIQDMHGPEFYFERFEVVNEETQTRSVKVGKYVDFTLSEPNSRIDFDNSSDARAERQTYVAVSIPAVNEWIQKIEEEQYKFPSLVTPAIHQTKRSFEEMEINNSECNEEAREGNKRQCTKTDNLQQANSVISKEHLLNFPIADSKGKVCHLVIYQNCDSIKMNLVYDFIGFLSVDPALAVQGDEEMTNMEFQVHNPSPSLIPRIHCVAFKPLQHNNPLVTVEKMNTERMQCIKKELLILWTQLMCGDELAAEYLIYHLISEVYLRKDFMALGKFSLNISNMPIFEDLDCAQEVYKFIEMMVTKSHYLPMSLENMNELTFVPKKDYEANRLTSSILQLSSNTHLLVDETKLNAGKLNEAGVAAVKALANAIKNQRTMYDFTYYQIEFECDIPFLILSEGKSMLPSDVHVVLQPDDMHLKTFGEILQAARHFLKELLNEIRIYLTSARLVEYALTDKVQDLIQNEFVNMRQNGKVSADDLHNLLVLARLVCISSGKTHLDEECWKRACTLEEARKRRLTVPL